ncbi:DUF6233 domain-containing protein [Streptomyces sp. NPDC058653]|uniref:DUF6233 domain-containing protein n=1 Tax=Streptomyces sp. NPDC058653 TaxID=3346576 RepID=UPI0036630E63
MSDRERIEMLRFLERVQLQQLAQTRRWIARAEERAKGRGEGRAKGRGQGPAGGAAAASAPGAGATRWTLDGGKSAFRAIHQDPKCFAVRSPLGAVARAISREEAIEALTHGGLPACEVCRPDLALGLS